MKRRRVINGISSRIGTTLPITDYQKKRRMNVHIFQTKLYNFQRRFSYEVVSSISIVLSHNCYLLQLLIVSSFSFVLFVRLSCQYILFPICSLSFVHSLSTFLFHYYFVVLSIPSSLIRPFMFSQSYPLFRSFQQNYPRSFLLVHSFSLVNLLFVANENSVEFSKIRYKNAL